MKEYKGGFFSLQCLINQHALLQWQESIFMDEICRYYFNGGKTEFFLYWSLGNNGWKVFFVYIEICMCGYKGRKKSLGSCRMLYNWLIHQNKSVKVSGSVLVRAALWRFSGKALEMHWSVNCALWSSSFCVDKYSDAFLLCIGMAVAW